MFDRFGVFGSVVDLRFAVITVVFALGVEFCKHLFDGHSGLCLHLTFLFRFFCTKTFFFCKAFAFTFVGNTFFFFGAEFLFFHLAKHTLDELSVFFALSQLFFGLT